jgi:hypothetical protein
MIDRSFYAYTSDGLSVDEFEERFTRFQGQNNRVLAKYVSSDFIHGSASEMATLEEIFAREERTKGAALAAENGANNAADFNTIVDLCGIFKQSSVHDVRDLIKRHLGPNRFLYIYHIDQTDSSDRVLCVNSDNDVQYDEEFYKYLCKTYGESLREKIFFFVDNRNVIGKGESSFGPDQLFIPLSSTVFSSALANHCYPSTPPKTSLSSSFISVAIGSRY